MTALDVAGLLARTDSDDRRQIYLAWNELGACRREIVPQIAQAYATCRAPAGRESHLFHVTPFARFDDGAVALGVRALHDRRKEVRARACLLLAHSRRTDAIPALEQAARGPTREVATRAAAALRAGTLFGPDDDPLYFLFGHDPHRAPRGTFAAALDDAIGPSLVARGFSPSYVFQHVFEYRRDTRVLRAEWDSYDVEARFSDGTRAHPAPSGIPELAAAIRGAI